ncbi:MAG: threonine aldolase family protein [Pseudomonadota bacterium]
MDDFYSDTKTKPTPEMRRTVLDAEVGDEQKGEDPTTAALCERVADMLGKEAALFLPSGTMCNEIAIRVHVRPGDEIICERNCHIVGFEGGGPAALSGAMVHPIDGERGMLSPEQVTGAIRTSSRYAPQSRLLSVEQTANMAGGAVWPVDQLNAVAEVAHAHGLATHMDGARLMNAVVQSGRPATDHTAGFDSCWIDFTKGLGAPIGAVLAGSKDFIAHAWVFKQQFGGAMRQSGIAAAMCLHALDHHVDRLAEDHTNAQRIADHLEGLPGVAQVLPVETNIVIFDLAETAPSAADLVACAHADGQILGAFGPRRIRIVTHLDVDGGAVDRLLAVLSTHLG